MSRHHLLIQQYYKSPNPKRQDELDSCLRLNLQSPYLEKIFLLNEHHHDFTEFPNNHKIHQIVIGTRLTYKRAFEFAQTLDSDKIKIVSNSDMSFDDVDSMELLGKLDLRNTCLALTRWDVQSYQPFREQLFVTDNSQDTWIFRDIKPRDDMDFEFGLMGCDNRIAWILNKMGYRVINPSRQIKTRHHHNSNHRPNVKYLQPGNFRTVTIRDLVPQDFLEEFMT